MVSLYLVKRCVSLHRIRETGVCSKTKQRGGCANTHVLKREMCPVSSNICFRTGSPRALNYGWDASPPTVLLHRCSAAGCGGCAVCRPGCAESAVDAADGVWYKVLQYAPTPRDARPGAASTRSSRRDPRPRRRLVRLAHVRARRPLLRAGSSPQTENLACQPPKVLLSVAQVFLR